jgi:hypothetical protein
MARAGHVKFGMEIYHKYVHKFLYVNRYKYGGGANLGDQNLN